MLRLNLEYKITKCNWDAVLEVVSIVQPFEWITVRVHSRGQHARSVRSPLAEHFVGRGCLARNKDSTLNPTNTSGSEIMSQQAAEDNYKDIMSFQI